MKTQCGIRKNMDDTAKPFSIEESGLRIVILNFGWEIIQCEIVSKYKSGINLLTKLHVLNSIQYSFEISKHENHLLHVLEL